jgi:metal-responsive CopG/Arc/MetJ family transcriptional regulator
MNAIAKLQTKQVGLKLPIYILEDLDKITKKYKVNRSSIILEALRAYITDNKQEKFYEEFREAMVEVKLMREGKLPKINAMDFIDELKNNANT